MRDLETRTF